MKVTGFIPHDSLKMLLLFEAQKHGVNIRYLTRNLRDFQPGDFAPEAIIVAHIGDLTHTFQLDLPEQTIKLEGDLHFPEGEYLYSHGQPLGVIQDRHLYLVFDPELILDAVIEDYGHTLNQLYGPIFEQALPRIAEYINTYDYGPEAKTYASHRFQADELRIKEMKNLLRNNEYTISEKVSELYELHRKQVELRGLIEFREQYTYMMRRNCFQAEYRSLMKMTPDPIRLVSFDAEELHITTRPIWIEYENHDYEMGQYVITLGFKDSSLRINTLRHGKQENPHPHISTDGIPCLGNLHSGVAKLLAEGDYAGLIQVLIQFLESYNDSNPYIHIKHWDDDYDPDEEQRESWDGCYETVGMTDCVDCTDMDCRLLVLPAQS